MKTMLAGFMRVVCFASSIAVCTFVAASAHAQEPATILNRAFQGSTGAGVDVELKSVSIDSVAVAGDEPQVQVAAGARTIEVLCSTRVFAGMGRVDLSTTATLKVDLEAGRVYQLDAKASEKGDCAPELKAQ
jgi:hypothetical protein